MKHLSFIPLVLLCTLLTFAVSSCCKDKDDIKVEQPVDQSGNEGDPDDPDDKPSNPSDDDAEPDDTTVHAGTAEDPYPIKTLADFVDYISENGNNAESYFRLDNNLVISASHTCDTFRAHLDGNNHTLTINNRTLFRCMYGATVKNLNISGRTNTLTQADCASADVNSTQFYFYAPLSSQCINSTIENCTSIFRFEADIDYRCCVSPLIGLLDGGTINGCKITTISNINAHGYIFFSGIAATIINSGRVVNSALLQGSSITMNSEGEMAGVTTRLYDGSIENCYVLANLTSTSSNPVYAAGIVTICNGGVVDNCYFMGTCSAYKAFAIARRIVKSESLIHFCYAPSNGDMPLIGSVSDGRYEACYELKNATTLSDAGYYGTLSLSHELTARSKTIPDARQWIEYGGTVIVVD